MNQKISVTPGALTVLQAKMGIAIAAAFLVFGLVFAGVVAQEVGSSEGGLSLLMILFMLIWVGVCVSMMVSFYRAMSRAGAPGDRSIVDLQFGEAPRFQAHEPPRAEEPPQGGDFEVRLRKLEALKRDGLLSESEYREKREQILREKW
jgi:hypothetical protein